MRFAAVLILASLVVDLGSAGCAAAPEVRPTGRRFDPLPEDAPVQVFLRPADAPSHEEIGRLVTHVRSLDLTVWRPLARATQLATEAARRAGGDCIVLVDVQTVSIVRDIRDGARVIDSCRHHVWVVGRLGPPAPPPGPAPPPPAPAVSP